MAQLTEWTQKPRKEPLRSTHLTSMVNVRVFDAKPISFEFPAGCSVVKGGAEGAGIARKRKYGYMDYQREQVNQIPNKLVKAIEPVHRCRGLNSLKISALNLKYLDLNGLDCPQLIMNCPQLVNFIVDDCPSMSRLEVSSCGFLDLSTTEVNVITGFSTTNMLRKVTLHGYRREVPDLHGFNGPGEITLHFRAQVLSIEALSRFLNLEDLSIESDWFKTQAESVEVSSLTLPLKFLKKKVHVKISTFDKEEIDLLGCLFRSTPSLQTMTLTLSRCSQYIHELSFLKQLLGLKRFSDSSVIIAEKYEGNCERCKEGE